ncbi:UNVERIFIED_CONTAM: hypothetical protein K2H54_073336 [Gekko kuhli]
MKTRCLLFLFVGLIFALCAQVPPASAQGRRGICPRPQGPGICVERCRNDRDCGVRQKCCSNGCGRVCMKAIRGRPQTTRGRCPRPQRPGSCARRCRNDRICGAGRKCCFNGCGRECMRAIRG